MYQIDRKDGSLVKVNEGERRVFTAQEDSIVVYENSGGETVASKISDLSDEQLLVALANRVVIPSVPK